jgi:hypothetical protein
MDLTGGQIIRSENQVSGSDGELKTCPDGTMVASGFK